MEVVVNFVKLLISGVQAIISFLLELPSILAFCVQAFPPALSVIFISVFGIILAVRALELLP